MDRLWGFDMLPRPGAIDTGRLGAPPIWREEEEQSWTLAVYVTCKKAGQGGRAGLRVKDTDALTSGEMLLSRETLYGGRQTRPRMDGR